MLIKVRKIDSENPMLTQKGRLSHDADAVVLRTRPTIMSTSIKASATSEIMYETLTGTMSPDTIIMFVMDECVRTGQSFPELVIELLGALELASLRPEMMTGLVQKFTGPNLKLTNIRLQDVTTCYAHKFRAFIKATFPTVTNPILIDAMTEIHMPGFKALGWVRPTSSIARSFTRLKQNPDVNDMINMIYAHRLRSVLVDVMSVNLQNLIGTSSDLVLQEGRNNTNVTAAYVGTAIQRRYAEAFQQARYVPEPVKMVASVFALLCEYWTPYNRPDNPWTVERVAKNQQLVDMLSNQTLFMIAEEIKAGKSSAIQPSSLKISYSVDEMTSTILPRFYEALVSISPYKLMSIGDAVSHFALSAVTDDRKRPVALYLTEHYDFTTSMDGIRLIKYDQKSTLRLISRHTLLSEKLKAILTPMQSTFSIDRLIQSELATWAMRPQHEIFNDKVGVELKLIVLAVRERFAERGLELPSDAELLAATVKAAGAGGTPTVIEAIVEGPDSDGDELQVQADAGRTDFGTPVALAALRNSMIDEAVRDLYFTLAELATVRSGSTEIGLMTTGKEEDVEKAALSPSTTRLVLRWLNSSDTAYPVSKSAIHGGLVRSEEPLEVIAYLLPFSNVATLKAKDLPFHDYPHALHQWKWQIRSKEVEYSTTYKTQIDGTQIAVELTHKDIFELSGDTTTELRLLVNKMAQATVTTWFDLYSSQRAALQSLSAAAKGDKNLADLFQFRADGYSAAMIRMLLNLGRTTVGQALWDRVQVQMYEQLRGLGKIDGYNELKVGVQEAKLYLWVGFVLLHATMIVDDKRLAKIETWTKTDSASRIALMELATARQRDELTSPTLL